MAVIVDPPPPPPPPNEPRLRSARTLRSATSTSPTVGATADPPVAPTDVPPWLDTRPPPPDTQDSSQLLLSRTQAQDDDGFIPITATNGHSTTTAAAAFLPPETVGIPQGGPPNMYAALDNASLVATPDRHGDELRPVAGTAVADSTGIKDFIDKLFDEFFGPDAPTDPTPLRIKGLFNDEARVVDRLLNDINEEHKRHATRTSQQITSLEESEMFTRGAIRADVTSLRTEMKDALTLLQTEMREALSPTFNSISGLTASALKLDQEVTGLLASSARAMQDILELRQELNGGGSLSDLAGLASNRNRRLSDCWRHLQRMHKQFWSSARNSLGV